MSFKMPGVVRSETRAGGGNYYCFAFLYIYYTSKNKKNIFSYVQTIKSRGYKPRLIIRNVLYTSFMNSLLNIKYRVISYTLSVTHGRCLFCSVGIILCIIFTFYFFYKYLSTSLMTPRNVSWSKLIMYNLCHSLLFLRL